VQDGATHGSFKVIQIAGIYAWEGTNKWLRLAQWTGFTGNHRGLFANLYITHVEGTFGTKLRVRIRTNASGALFNPLISIAHDHNLVITNAALIQTEADTLELWAFFPYGNVHVDGAVGATVGEINLTPYGNVAALVEDSPPSPISDGIYLEWNVATADQTFSGPGNIVAASRGTTSGYVRYDNGFQVAWGTITVGSGTWTYPAAFASPPQVQVTVQDTAPRLATITSVSTTAAGILRTDLSGNTQSGTVHLWAIGLWK
jgi:hypothetical protein